jgi:sortase A
MRIVIGKASLSRVLKWTWRAFFAGAVVMFGYCAFVLLDSTIFQHRQEQRLEKLLNDRRQAGNVLPRAVAAPLKPVSSVVPDGLIGRIEIARLGISVMVVEGTSKRALRRAAGHIPGTAMPGQPGNVGISAHRDTFFRPLRNVRLSDIVTLTTPGGEYRYRVVATKVVEPSDVAVLNPDGNQILTLITCYPFYFVGAAPSRFIVRAERIP